MKAGGLLFHSTLTMIPVIKWGAAAGAYIKAPNHP